ncbi:nucleotidyltransferase domain-containing protein [Haladaptatus cibarius]|uniref:nucleotidyltransferase domain-containing protein n=1 Tax=Haladaptatus cibarius TaxID=453847 RepID=UPI000678FCB8|nr:nucleotidyltransferase domain-containing protein [Haladaptatus cibarius]
MSKEEKQRIRVCIDVLPSDDTNVFRIGVADDILRLLTDANDTEFTISELVNATGVTRSTVWRAVQLLDNLGVVRIRETPQRNYVSIDPTRLQKDDPILAIEQPEFHDPVRMFIKEVQSALGETGDIETVVGIVLFGSVARGEADRQSDIDLFVVVDGDRTSARRHVTDVVSDLSERRFGGDRFDFEPYVESTESARRAGEKLRDIFEEGITVYGTEQLQSIRKGVFADE